jgi:hypothetical protein
MRTGYALVFGSPGERPRAAAYLYALWPLLAVGVAGGYLLRAVFPQPHMSATLAGVLFLALAVALAAAVNAGHGRLGAFVKGARGEERVAHELGFLPHGYAVFHGLAGRRGNVMPREDFDHVVAGPTGVFVVETKNWSGGVSVRDGRILCGGQDPDRPPLDQVGAAAHTLRRRLGAVCGRDIAVQPIVCLASNTVQGGRLGVAGAIVCNVDRLNGIIRESAEDSLSAEEQARVMDFLKKMAD